MATTKVAGSSMNDNSLLALTDEEVTLLNDFRKCDDDGRQIVAKYARTFARVAQLTPEQHKVLEQRTREAVEDMLNGGHHD